MHETFFKNIKNPHQYIIFLSDITLEHLKCCNCGSDNLKKKHLKNFYNLWQTEELLTIINPDYINFLKLQMYFDSINNNFPKRDCLYIRINNHYYISYENYLENITKFNFDLYSSLFSKFGLKKISCQISKNTFNNRNISNNLNAGIGKLSFTYNDTHNSNTVELISEEFNYNPDNITNIMNFKRLKYNVRKQHIVPYVPTNYNGTSIMYLPSLNMNNINKVIDESVDKLIYSFELKTHSIKNILVGLGESYTPLNISNKFNYELECKEEQFIKFDYEFYNMNEIQKNIVNTNNTTEYFLSNGKNLQGPWPVACTKIKTFSGISNFNSAIKLSKKLINIDPENTINEIRYDMTIYGIKLSVHQWKLKNKDMDITYGPGIRYLHFHNIKFKQKNRAIQLLKMHGF